MMKRPTLSGGPFHFPYQRIVVTGANGAGKTWFARRLSTKTGIAWINNDALVLGTDWAYRTQANIEAAQRRAIAAPSWILDGGPSLIRAEITDRAEVIIWLDVPRVVRVRRIIWRSFIFIGRTRPEHPQGNVEWPGLRQWRFITKAWRNDDVVCDHLNTALLACAVHHMHLRSVRDVSQFLNCVQFPRESAKRL